MSLPLVAIVGRPNVGKSTLFNKIVGRRVSIVEDKPGITRDRIYNKANWQNYDFMLVDTGGIETFKDDFILEKIREQADIAINHADVIIFVCDITSGLSSTDLEIADILRKSQKNIILCLNKEDRIGTISDNFYDFYALGFDEPYVVSSVHGHGTGDLLDKVCSYFPDIKETEIENFLIKVAVIGKPNVGKSSLINKILSEDRMIVSNEAGTTRDAVDSHIKNDYGEYIFIDTAGIRRRKKIIENVEKYSVLRSYMAVDNADVCVIMIDAIKGFSEQDTKIAGYAHEQGKACIIAINKWDIVEKDDKTMIKEKKKLEDDFSFMSYVPIIFISAKTGQRIDKLFSLINYVSEQNAMRITTGVLNDILSDAVSRVEPPTDKGKRLKIYYITQASTKPPTFVLFVNNRELFHFSYQRYIENQIRDVFGLEGTPIRMIIRERKNN